jgi:5-(carboxyamino)imidazole ribonucleotide synthase
MVNLVGELPDPAAVLAVEGAHLHRYGKAPRPGRKVGHVTVAGPDLADVTARARRAATYLAYEAEDESDPSSRANYQ